MPKIFIDEEYGYKHWIADLTDEEYSQLITRWRTLRGLNCCVPVKFVIPQAKRCDLDDWLPIPEDAIRCHMHEADDSSLQGSKYRIPDDKDFWMEGIAYSFEEISAIMDDERYQ